MVKLYPPSIEGKLPAFAGDTLKIPLTMNRAVNMSEVSGMRAMVKTVQTATLKTILEGSLSYESTTGKYYAVFELANKFTPNLGQYYKIQVAYVDKFGEIGYYSSVGVSKYTSYPSVTIPGLENNFYGGYEYVGVYSQEDGYEKIYDPDFPEDESKATEVLTVKRDGTEKIYSYCFELTDTDGNLVATSGTCLHNSSNDNTSTTKTQDSWSNKIELQRNKPYYLTYKVTTMNGLTVSSARYPLMDQDSVDANLPVALIADLNYDDGCVGLYFYPIGKRPGEDITISGSFVLSRASSLNDFTTWDEVYRFSYSNVNFTSNESLLLWEDFTVQQGVEYKYSLQAYNSYGLYSNRILNINNIVDKEEVNVFVDFEDAFLYDGDRQLKIRFNPKISSFKANVLESKMETIGSQFPFIFRNGKVDYKEFPISGLISMLSDSNERFLKGIQSENLYPYRKSTSSFESPSGLDTTLTANNVLRERKFKMEVLAWLNNGKPKLFRSPAEGNYIVRLMNVSLAPNDTLGRMLHTFSCTAYEIAEYSFNSLINLGLIILPASDTTSLKVGQIHPKALMMADEKTLQDNYPDFIINGNTIGVPSVYQGNITYATPGTVIGFNFANGQGVVNVEIGGTGSYYIQTDEYPLVSISLVRGDWDDAKFTFSYYDDTPVDTFSQVAKLEMTDEIRQFIGTGFDKNIITQMNIQDIRRELGAFHYIKVMKRQVEKLWRFGSEYSRNEYGTDIVKPNEWNKTVIYYVVTDAVYFDGAKDVILKGGAPDYRFAMNPKNELDYMDFEGRSDEDVTDRWGDSFGRIDAIRNVDKVTELRIGTGLLIDIAYRVRTKEYVVETTDGPTADAKKQWTDAMAYINRVISSPSMTESIFNQAVSNANAKYMIFINVLSNALNIK